MAITNCPRCGKHQQWDPFEDPHCAACREVLALMQWLLALMRELATLAHWDDRAASLEPEAAERSREALAGLRRRCEEWLRLAADTLEHRRTGGPLVPRLRIAPLVAPRIAEAMDVLEFVIPAVLAPPE